jgi:dipeptidase
MAKAKGKITTETMMNILRDHVPVKKDWNPAQNATLNSLCVHAKGITNPSQSTISLVAELDEKLQLNWITGTSAPCLSTFKPVFLPGGLPKISTPTTEFYNENNLWWRHEFLHRLVLQDYVHRTNLFMAERNIAEQIIISETSKFLEQHTTKYKDLESEESRKILREYTKIIFEKVQDAEEKWIEKVKNEPIKKKTNVSYRIYWAKRNKWNKMPKM